MSSEGYAAHSTAPVVARIGQSGLLSIARLRNQIPPEGKRDYHHRRPWLGCLHPAENTTRELGMSSEKPPPRIFEFEGGSEVHGPLARM
jgi:hypothetical protein